MALTKGDLVLVSGVNGYIASHVAHQCLQVGLKVRGTVRDMSKAEWEKDVFTKRYGAGMFEAVVVKEMAEEGAFDEAAKGCHGIVHVASNMSFAPDPNAVIPGVIAGVRNILKTAAKTPTVRRFVYTSSSTAAVSPVPNKKFHVDSKTWNTEAVRKAWAPPPYEAERGGIVYASSKTEGEQACWDFMKDEKPQFVLNAVLPNYMCGEILHPDQPASTGGFIQGLWNGDQGSIDRLSNFTPQYFVDVKDSARLHVSGLIHDDVKSERLLAFTAPFNFNKTLATMKKIDPNHKLPAPLDDPSEDLSTIDTKRSEELLRRMGRPGFTDYETSIKENIGRM